MTAQHQPRIWSYSSEQREEMTYFVFVRLDLLRSEVQWSLWQETLLLFVICVTFRNEKPGKCCHDGIGSCHLWQVAGKAQSRKDDGWWRFPVAFHSLHRLKQRLLGEILLHQCFHWSLSVMKLVYGWGKWGRLMFRWSSRQTDGIWHNAGARLHKVSQTVWVRSFQDCVGLKRSHDTGHKYNNKACRINRGHLH